MLRAFFGVATLLVISSVAIAAPSSQTIKCENKSQGLSFNVKLDNFTDEGSEADVRMDVNLKNKNVFQGTLVREKLSAASSPGTFAISGEGSARNFSLEIVLTEAQIKKGFKNVTLSAFLDNPLSDQGYYPHRVPVKCSSRIN